VELTYTPTRTVSSRELGLTCDPIEFTVKTVIPRPIRRLMVEFEQSGYSDTALACQIIGKVFVSARQNGASQPFTQEGAEALRASVNETMEGAGDEFVCALVDGFINNHYGFFTKD
jgi:hypothetical protein